MTYCAGWKYSDYVILVADTLATRRSRPATTHTSFGELHDKVRDEYVEESLLKIVPLSSGVAVAYAGDVLLAMDIIEFLAKHVPSHLSDLKGLLAAVTTSLGPFSSDRTVELLLASTSQVGVPQLLHWDTVVGLDETDADYYEIGSLKSYHTGLAHEINRALTTRTPPRGQRLALVTGFIQSFGVHDNLVQQNVGGLIFGLSSHAGMLTWQDDTNYVLYDREARSLIWTTALVRDDVLVVNSTHTNAVRCFATSVSTRLPDEWRSKWVVQINDSLEANQCRYWVLISTFDRAVTVIQRQYLYRPSRYVKVENQGDGNYTISLSEELVTRLKEPLNRPQPEALPYRLRFLED